MGLRGGCEVITIGVDVVLFTQRRLSKSFFELPRYHYCFYYSVRKAKWPKIHYVIPDKISF